MTIIAYHGTDLRNLSNIISNGYNVSSEKEWFGSGYYFFESLEPVVDGADEAECWVKYVRKFKKWAIFEALIESDRYIDLLSDREHKLTYDKIRKKCLDLFIKAGNNKKDFIESTIYTKFEESGVDFIRALVEADKYKGYYAYTIRRPQVQICVKNKNCIIENIVYKQG